MTGAALLFRRATLPPVRPLLLFLALAGFAIAADLPPTGLLISCEPPSTYVELIRFNEIKEHPVISDVILPSKAIRQLFNTAIIVRFDYPDAVKGPLTTEKAAATIAQAQAMAAKYPQYKYQLAEIIARWQTALSSIKAPPKATPIAKVAPIKKPPTEPKLKIGEVTYLGVKLGDLEEYTLKITHLEGIARFAIAHLTQEEIDAINEIAGGLLISPEDFARAKAADAAAALTAKQSKARKGRAALPSLKAEVAKAESDLKQIQAQLAATAAATPKSTPASRRSPGQTRPGSGRTAAAPTPSPAIVALRQQQRTVELELTEAAQEVARIEAAPPEPAPSAAPSPAPAVASIGSPAPSPSMEIAGLETTTVGSARTAVTPPSAPIAAIPPRNSPAPESLTPTVSSLANMNLPVGELAQAMRPNRPPIDLTSAKACYQELAELATCSLLNNSAGASRLTILGRFDNLVDALDWAARAAYLLESSDPAFVATVKKVKGIHADFLRLRQLEDDFGASSAGVDPALSAAVERPISSESDKQVVVYRDGKRTVYVDHNDQTGPAGAGTDKARSPAAKPPLEEQLRGAELSRRVELAEGILFSQLDAVWTAEILPHLAPKPAATAPALIALEAPDRARSWSKSIAASAGCAFVHGVSADFNLNHCTLIVHVTDDLGHHTSWFGYFPKIVPSDGLIIKSGGIDLAALAETASTISGSYSFSCDEGAISETAFSWPSPTKPADAKSAAAQNAKLREKLAPELDLAAALLVRARFHYHEPVDPVSARAKLAAALQSGRVYSASSNGGRSSLTLAFQPFNASASLIKADGELTSAQATRKFSLTGRFEEEVSRGCVIAFIETNSPAFDQMISDRLLWLVTEPRAVYHASELRSRKMAAPPYVIYLDENDRPALQQLSGGSERISFSLLSSESAK